MGIRPSIGEKAVNFLSDLPKKAEIFRKVGVSNRFGSMSVSSITGAGVKTGVWDASATARISRGHSSVYGAAVN